MIDLGISLMSSFMNAALLASQTRPSGIARASSGRQPKLSKFRHPPFPPTRK